MKLLVFCLLAVSVLFGAEDQMPPNESEKKEIALTRNTDDPLSAFKRENLELGRTKLQEYETKKLNADD